MKADASDAPGRAKTDPAKTSPVAPPPQPGRTLGFVIMSLLILFVAVFMTIQGDRELREAAIEETATDSEIAGFQREAWYLPDDPLLGFVEIEAGPFTMGSNPALDRMAYQNERWSSLQRQGQMRLPRYYIARFETTIAQFNEFVRDTGLAQAAAATTRPRDFPVSNVTWPEALAYGRWLDQQLRSSDRTPEPLRSFLQSGARVTLPSEAEWEKAARGSDGRIFPWGDRPRAELANFRSEAPVAVTEIACSVCAHGLSGMAGNVWELTRSPLQDYPFDETDDDQTLAGPSLWVMRGGSYADDVNNIRAAVRGAVDPGVRNDTIGFRVVISRVEQSP